MAKLLCFDSSFFSIWSPVLLNEVFFIIAAVIFLTHNYYYLLFLWIWLKVIQNVGLFETVDYIVLKFGHQIIFCTVCTCMLNRMKIIFLQYWRDTLNRSCGITSASNQGAITQSKVTATGAESSTVYLN